MTAGWEQADGRLGPGAEYYAGTLGWHVLPCWGIVAGKCACGETHEKPKDNGKHPHGKLVPTGAKEATSDVDVVRTWWESDPEANIGVRCRESGFLVVDVDPRSNGHTSFLRLEELVDGDIPDTVEAQTGQYSTREGVMQGRHLFYRVEAGERLRGDLKGEGLPGIEIKHNGYVLINPSRHASGVIYEWCEGKAPWDREITEAPEKLLGLLRKRGPAAAGGTSFGSFEWNGEKIDLDAILEEGIQEGERATTLFKITCVLANQYPVDTEHGRASVKQLVAGINARHCFPPMDWGSGGPDDFEPQCDNAINFVRENPKSRALWTVQTDEYVKSAQHLLASAAVAEGGVRTVADASAVEAETERSGWGGRPATPAVDIGLPEDIDNPLRPLNPDEVTSGIHKRSLSDTGNATRFADVFGPTTKHSPGAGWYAWDGSFWRSDDGDVSVWERMKSLPAYVVREAATYTDPDKVTEVGGKWAIKCKANATIKNAMENASKDPRVTVPVALWDSHEELLGVRNGVINLRTGDLMPPRAELFITKRTEVAYTPGMKNRRWEDFLEYATGGDKEFQAWLQRAAGYTLTGRRTFDVLFMIHGSPGSGKSTFLETLGHMLGEYHWIMSSDVLIDTGQANRTDEYHWASLRGRRMVSISELPEAKRTKENAIKQLTGEDVVPGRFPGERPFVFRSQAKIWIGTNNKPQIRDEAMWRRIRAIPFENVPERPDPELKSYLIDPEGGLPAALAWAVEGAISLLGSPERDALGWCTAVREDTAKYRKEEDKVGLFMADEMKTSPGVSVRMRDLHVIYRRWSEDRGEHPMSIMPFQRKFEDKGIEVVGTGGSAVVKDWMIIPRVATSSEVDWGSLVPRSNW